MEKTPEEHIEKLVIGFREVRRVLRDDGCIFLNYGDKYNGGNNRPIGGMSKMFSVRGDETNPGLKVKGLKQGDLVGLAWRLALALQADGWYLRSDIIWAKALSFCPTYSGSTMPESVNGWRWERHRVKVKSQQYRNTFGGHSDQPGKGSYRSTHAYPELAAQWADCPGCPKCLPNDGLVLRKGSWRPTRAHEYLFLLAKTQNYYADMEAVREESLSQWNSTKGFSADGKRGAATGYDTSVHNQFDGAKSHPDIEQSGRNLRDVWCINPQAYPDSHYATFPEKLVEPCIKVSTSEKGCCPKCGSQWARIVKVGYEFRSKRPAGIINGGTSLDTSKARKKGGIHEWPIVASSNTTLGWRPTCKCGEKETVPAVVLDPFAGSGTTCAVAARLGRNYIGIELNPKYITEQANYRVAEAETGVPTEEQKTGQAALSALYQANIYLARKLKGGQGSLFEKGGE